MPFVVRQTSRTPETLDALRQIDTIFFFNKWFSTCNAQLGNAQSRGCFHGLNKLIFREHVGMLFLQTPSSGIQYRRRRLHNSVTETRK